MQNDYGELWSLLHWANPTRMGDWEQFQDFYVKPLKEGQRRDCTDLQLAKVDTTTIHCFPLTLPLCGK